MLVIGGYTQRMDENTPGKARGISVYDFFPADGRIEFRNFIPETNPSYVVTDRSRQIIYAVREHAPGQGAGVVAYKVGRDKKGKLKFEHYGEVDLPGADPCHLVFAERNLVVSCYSSGHVMLLPLPKDGRLSEIGQTFGFTTEGKRGSHIHCAAYDAARSWILVTDLGADRLRVLEKTEKGDFAYKPSADVQFDEMCGPRHVTIHPEGRFAVVNGECKGIVGLIDLEATPPKLAYQANALPERVVNEAHGAAIRLSNGGKMVYTTDRNFSVINALKLDLRDQTLLFRHSTPSGGEHPRDLILSPEGEWLLTANQKTNSVGVFRVDPRGELTHYHSFQKVPTPTSFAWL